MHVDIIIIITYYKYFYNFYMLENVEFLLKMLIVNY